MLPLFYLVHHQILGTPYDSCKFHSTASHRAGSCSLWDTNNVMQAKVTLKEIAAIKFSVFSKTERNQGIVDKSV